MYICHIERQKYKFKLNVYLFHVDPVDQLSAETGLPTSEENTSHDVRAQFLFLMYINVCVNKIWVMLDVLSCEYLYSLVLSKVPKLSFILGFCWT